MGLASVGNLDIDLRLGTHQFIGIREIGGKREMPIGRGDIRPEVNEIGGTDFVIARIRTGYFLTKRNP